MLQRVQSLLLLITALAMAAFLATNSYVKTFGSGEKILVNAFHVLQTKGTLTVVHLGSFRLRLATSFLTIVPV